MARSRSGKLLGRAAADERRDQRRWLHEEALRAQDAAKLKAEAEAIIEENDLIRFCIAAEGEKSFFKWWDDDEQVPVQGRRSERIALLKARLNVHEGSVQADAKAV